MNTSFSSTATRIVNLLVALPLPLFLEVKRRLQQQCPPLPEHGSATSTDAAFLERVQDIVDENMANSNFGVEWLACEVGLSRRQLQRRVRAATQLSAGQFVRTQRLRRAAQLLVQQSVSATEVAEAVGYRDPKHFSHVFKRTFGMTPSRYAARAGEKDQRRVMSRLRVVACVGLLWGVLGLFARAQTDRQQETHGTEQVQQDSSSARQGRLAVLPIVFSSPNTGFAAGVLPQYFFTASASRPSTIRLDAYLTQKKQYHIQLTPRIWLKANRYRLTGKLSFKEWPTSFYGIGGTTATQGAEKYTERFFVLSVDLQRQVRPGLFVGGGYGLRSSRIKDIEPGGALQTGGILGSEGGKASRMWVSASWDTRDEVYFPVKGSLYQASVSAAGPALGSDFRFATLTLDFRRYVSPVASHVLAVQAYASLLVGNPPFQMLAGMGDVLRGYPAARFVDRSLIAFQMEYRVVPVWWRIGIAVFAGVGEVGDTLTSLSTDHLKYSVGVGLRFQLYRSAKINIRWDYGIGRDTTGDYLDLTEAF